MKTELRFKSFLLFIILLTSNALMAQLHGYVKDSETGEVLIGAIINNKTQKKISITNNYGFFAINSSQNDVLDVSYLNYEKLTFLSQSSGDVKIILLKKIIITLNEVVVQGETEKIFDDLNPGKIKFNQEQIKAFPMLLGEKDPLKALQFLPGIQEISEGSASLSVRGGDASQNLLLLDEAIVYNANHLFGFFSTFNPDPIKLVDTYKGSFPAQYGGRLSSIIDVRMREGNNKKFNIEGGIGLIASRLLIEGPIVNEKASYLISLRRTYADQLLMPFQSSREKTGYYFGDINAKLNYSINTKNQIFLSSYSGKDSFYNRNKIPRKDGFLINNFDLNWKNITLSTRWNKIYNEKLFHNLSFIYTKYNMNLGEETKQDYLIPPRYEALKISSSIKDFSLKIDFDYFKNSLINIKWGGNLTQHNFSPRLFKYESSRNNENLENNSKEVQNYEAAAYINMSGSKNNFFYQTGLRIGLLDKPFYFTPEPRIVLGYKVKDLSVLTFSYSRMNQFLHLISNTGNGLPTDIWIPSTINLKKATSDLISFDYTKNINENYNITFDSYYKWIYGNTAYKSDVSFFQIGSKADLEPFQWENSLLQGKSWNYGFEFLMQKTKGRLTGILGYTLAWSIAKFDKLNNGMPFYNRHDRRHITELSLNYKLSKKIKFSTNFIFATGNALSIPNSIFFKQDKLNDYLESYAGVNSFRAENFHRLDIGFQFESKRKNNYWEFSIYNVYNRKNPYSYSTSEFYSQNRKVQTVGISRQWLIPILPSISYNFKIR